jgi:nitric oxide reductase NorD protein
MGGAAPRSAAEIEAILDRAFEVEFTFRNSAATAAALAGLPRDQQDFILNWTQRVASTNIEVGYQFAIQAIDALNAMERRTIEAWALHAMDCYDRSGLRPALNVIADIDRFVQMGQERAAGAVLEDEVGVLAHFVHGLPGRKLKIEESERIYTDTETVYLPAVVARFPDARDNFRLYKAMVAHHWAQTRFGTFNLDLTEALAEFDDRGHALACFRALELLRLDACVQRELPGLFREMTRLRGQLGQPLVPGGWQAFAEQLAAPSAAAIDSLELVVPVYGRRLPSPVCYQGELLPEVVAATRERRLEREKAYFRVKLAEVAEELAEGRDLGLPERFEMQEKGGRPDELGGRYEITLDDRPVPVPEAMANLMSSIIVDMGEIPDDYLVPAGAGEYDLRRYEEQKPSPEDVWQGAYHEEGAFLYNEWDFKRQHYRKNWCVVRELKVEPVHDRYAEKVTEKYLGLVKHLRKTFEAMADEDRLLKRQTYGDGIDIDALVEAWADVHSGLEMSDRLFTRMHREERNIAVVIMVDMSGSTKGWINDAEREALILLSESLQALGDRYAIYGFSGTTRKRCEMFTVKTFEEAYDREVQGRISGIRPKDYTRMGPAIRHLSQLLRDTEARTKLLVTLSDGKPEDYDGYYLGEYGIEDTRQALFEARRDGIHPFCITIDEKAREYLPHMYGAANYIVIEDVAALPYKVSDIYRKITT